MILSEFATVTWGRRNKKHFIKKGYYFTKSGDKFVAKIEDLTPKSNVKIECVCIRCFGIRILSFNEYKPKCYKCTRMTDDRKEMLREINKKITGALRYNYKSENRYEKRNVAECVHWAKSIKKRDDYTCQICFVRGGKLHAHHLMAWKSYPEFR